MYFFLFLTELLKLLLFSTANYFEQIILNKYSKFEFFKNQVEASLPY